MRNRGWKLVTLSATALAGVTAIALSTPPVSAQYKMTVNQDRLINAQNEPQN